jgi:hypothetical protein
MCFTRFPHRILFAALAKQVLQPLPPEFLLDSVTFWQDGLRFHGATHIQLEAKQKSKLIWENNEIIRSIACQKAYKYRYLPMHLTTLEAQIPVGIPPHARSRSGFEHWPGLQQLVTIMMFTNM